LSELNTIPLSYIYKNTFKNPPTILHEILQERPIISLDKSSVETKVLPDL